MQTYRKWIGPRPPSGFSGQFARSLACASPTDLSSAGVLGGSILLNCKFWAPVLGVLFLAACAPGSSVPDGAVLLEENVSLVRGPDVDSAQREFDVDGGSVVVALVDEQMTDVKLQLAIVDSSGRALTPVEVENNLRGAGVEIAALTVLLDSHIRVTLIGEQGANKPGQVRLKLRRFEAGKGSNFSSSRDAYKSWSIATTASYREDAIEKSALADIDSAIAGLDSSEEEQARRRITARAHGLYAQ